LTRGRPDIAARDLLEHAATRLDRAVASSLRVKPATQPSRPSRWQAASSDTM
jgi:hypothetical protein